MATKELGSVSNSLIIAPQWIGDAVMTEPLLRRLHARGERLSVGALPWVAPIYRAMPQVAEVIEFPFAHGGLQFKGRHSLARALTGRFDTAYVCPNSLKSALLPFLASIPKRVGYLGEARVGLLTHRLKNPPKTSRPPMVAFYSALSGEADTGSDRPNLQIAREETRAVLQKLSLPAAYYVFVPGAEFGPAKRWPASHFAELASLLEHPVLLLGSPKELALCQNIADQVNHKVSGQVRTEEPQLQGLSMGSCRSLAGDTTLKEAMALIAGAKAVVTNDTGLMHVAAAMDVSQVAIFGSSSPLHTPPLSEQARVLWLKNETSYQPALDCAPCFQRVCPLGHLRCLNDLSVQQVRMNL